MSTGLVRDPGRIRLVFELAREDHPRLFDDLIRFQKGTKRINRLRVLAHDGLLVHDGRSFSVGPSAYGGILDGGTQEGNGYVTNGVFGAAIAE